METMEGMNGNEDNGTVLPALKSVDLEKAADESPEKFCNFVEQKILDGIGGTLDATTMPRLNGSQITLIAYMTMREELLEGGFVQLIYNGYGPFIFENPFAKAMRLWGIKELCNMLYDVRRMYEKDKDEITRPCSDEQFMALYERFEQYDKYDDGFVEAEPEYTGKVAQYVFSNIADFAVVS